MPEPFAVVCTGPPRARQKGRCGGCGGPIERPRISWCSDECVKGWIRNHQWGKAREAAILRDGGCVRCGSTVRLEVNHIVPRVGRGYGPSDCAHHLDGLETLCHDCHVQVTNAQRLARRGVKGPSQQPELLALDPPGGVSLARGIGGLPASADDADGDTSTALVGADASSAATNPAPGRAEDSRIHASIIHERGF